MMQVRPVASSGSKHARIRCAGTASTILFEASRRLPLSIPADELYFWAEDWQASERRAEAEYANGESQEFANFADLARDLLSD